MNTIEQHINNLFDNIPETEEVRRVKDELYLNALDRYEELMTQGKTPSEAVGTIIFEIGEREDVFEKYDYNFQLDEGFIDEIYNTLEEARELIDTHRREGNKIGLGVTMILFGGGLVATLSTFGLGEIGVILFLVLVALAVGTFIMSGFVIEDIGQEMNSENNMFYLSDEDYEAVQDEFVAFKRSERYRIPLGVMLCILSVTPILAFTFINQDLLTERFGVLIFVIMVGVGVYQFILYGMTSSAYEKVLSIGEYSIAERRFRQKSEPLSGIYWIAVVLIYLAWSFITTDWHISWIIWPIAGILWALITAIMNFFIQSTE